LPSIINKYIVSLTTNEKIEAVIPAERLSSVNSELKKIGSYGITCFDSKGRGQIPIKELQTARGTGRYTPEFNTNCSIFIVVRDSDADKVIQAIVNTASTGLAGEGKIYVSSIDEAIDIATKARGESVL